MLIEPEISAVSVVMIGNFNPPIFSPAWFARHKLITDEQSDAAELAIVHPSVTQARFASFLVTVEPERFQIQTTEAPFIRLSDLLQKMFGELLPHTPVWMVGINREVHTSVGSQAVRNKIGKLLAPLEPWGDWAEAIGSGEGPRQGGLRSIVMEQRDLEDRARGSIQATVQPSIRVPDNAGIYISINDHFEAPNPNDPDATREVLKFLAGRFDASIRNSEHIIDQVLRLRDA